MIQRIRERYSSVFLIAILAVFIFVSLNFAKVQSLWTDETTQLSGSTLSPFDIVNWLAGEDIARFGVPGDRMPPLSYFLGWAWTKLVGSDPFNHRVLSLSFVTTAAVAVWFAAKRVGGVRGACLATGFFCFSPNIVTIGVEIRAYPVFLTISAIGFLVLLWGVLGDEKRAAKSVWLLCIASSVGTSYFLGTGSRGTSHPAQAS